MMFWCICVILIFLTARGSNQGVDNLANSTLQQFFQDHKPLLIAVPFPLIQQPYLLKNQQLEELNEKYKEMQEHNKKLLNILTTTIQKNGAPKSSTKKQKHQKKNNKRKREESFTEDSDASENQHHKKKKRKTLKPIREKLASTLNFETYYEKNTGQKKPRKHKEVKKK